ncbi:MAG: glycosyltransferase family 4 protein [Polyangiaceae bacterium]|nr:glycosyltransferase family 4 protein [Polyangiaceae bacterium]
MKILHLLPGTGWGGAERAACTLHRLALEHGHESKVDCRFTPEMAAAFTQETGETLPSAQRGESATWLWALAARKRKKAFSPDLIHAHLSTPSAASSLSFIAGKVPLVFTFHLLPATEKWSRVRFLPWGSRSFIRWLLASNRRIRCVAVSARDQSILAEMLGLQAVSLAVNAPPYPPARPSEHTGPMWDPGNLRLLSVGRLNHQKGFDQILSALGTPCCQHLPFQWVVIGEGEERQHLEETLQASPIREKVRFLGARPADEAFAQAELVLCPSRFEGMPLVPLEAISTGAPVVLSRIPPHLEMLPGLERAFLPLKLAEWPQALAELITSPELRAQIQAEEAARVSSNPRQRWWEDYARIYEETLRG